MVRRTAAGDPGTMPWAPQGGLIRRGIETGARLLRRAPRQGAALPGAAHAPGDAPQDPATAAAPPAPRPCHRRAWADRLWGEGMALPGGANEVLRLAALLPLSPETTLLMAGAGARAAGGVVAGARGCFVAGFDPAAPPPARGPARGRVTTDPFDPAAPAFRARYHHHALFLEPLRGGGTPAALLAAAAAGLRPGGQVVLLDLVAAGPPEPRWMAAERRAAPPAEDAMPEALDRAGFQLHVVEDAGRRHRDAVLAGWRALTEAMRAAPDRPSPPAAADLVAEAEAWLLRLRLLRDGRLRLLRWHASLAR